LAEFHWVKKLVGLQRVDSLLNFKSCFFLEGRVAHTPGGAYVPTVFVGMYAPQGRYNVRVSELKHYYGLNHLHYLTTSTYRRARLFDSERFRKQWVVTLGELRRELGFQIIGYVLMPEHFHALIWPTAEASPSQIMQKLEDRTALFILRNLQENLGYAWCRKMLARVTLPPTVHHHAHFRVWQRKFYDMNIGDASLLSMDRVPYVAPIRFSFR